MTTERRARWGANLCNASILSYMIWLVLPMAQAALHAVTGVATLALFGLGVVWEGQTLRTHPWRFCLRVLCAVALPLGLYFLLERGGGNLPGYLVQQGMFWFPLLWCAYARERGDTRLYRWVKPVMIALFAITTLTTAGWLVQGMLRGGKVYAYARSLGSGDPGRLAYLRELMLRNIGGYDFVYATVALLPAVFYLACQSRGWKRAGWIAAYVAQLAMIGLSQYTYAILFTLGVTALELLALLLRALFRRLRLGSSLLLAALPLGALWFFRLPLLQWAGNVAAGLGFENARYSLTQLLAMLDGGTVDGGSRLITYTTPLEGFLASPWIGSLAGGAKALGMHSDLLDMLSAVGVLGTAVFVLAVWLIGRGSGKGIRRSPARAQLMLMGLVVAACFALGTVFYSREISLAVCLSAALLLRRSDTSKAVA